MQIAVSLTDTSRPAQCFMAVLPLLTFEAGSSGPHVQRQCEGLPPPPPATTAGTAVIPHLNKGLVHGWGHVDFLTSDGSGVIGAFWVRTGVSAGVPGRSRTPYADWRRRRCRRAMNRLANAQATSRR